MISVKCPACGLVDWNTGDCNRCGTSLVGLDADGDSSGYGYFSRPFDHASLARSVRGARIVMAVCVVCVLGLSALGALYLAHKPSKPQWFWSFYRSEPTVAEIFAHNLEVSGGAARVRALRSFRGEGKLVFVGGDAGRAASMIGGEVTFVMHGKLPDKSEMEIEMGAAPSSDLPFYQQPSPSDYGAKITANFRRGFNGTRGWEYTERTILKPGSTVPLRQYSTHELEGDELARMRRSSRTTGLVRVNDEYSSLKLTGRQLVNWGTQFGMTHTGHWPIDKDIHGHEVYVVSGVNREGENETLYFDTQTGLLLRVDFEAREKEGETAKVTCTFGDYKEVGGLKLPHRVHFRQDEKSMTLTLEKYLLNEPVPDSTFEMPE
jgi:hypothetical protein